MVVGYHHFGKPYGNPHIVGIHGWFVGSNSPKDILRLGLFGVCCDVASGPG